jgi:putative flippase GtrA
MSFVIYIVVQIAAYAVDFSVYAVLLSTFRLSPVLSNVIAKVAAGGLAFFCHRTFTFKANTDGIARQAMLYTVLLVLNIPLSSALLSTFIFAGLGPFAAKLVADVCGVAINFALSKSIAFRPHPQRKT